MNTEYVTKPGDRWDLIAFKAYGTVGEVTLDDGGKMNAMSLVVNSNPGISLVSVLDEGLLLQIPTIPSGTAAIAKDLLPPWKQ